MSKPDRVFRALLRLLPAEFRGEYEREMTAAFRAERQAAGSPGGLLRLWLATLADLVRTAPREHLDILTRDVSYTVRMLVRRPTLTLTAILTLALGIGANTAIFSVVNGVVFAPLPYPDAERLVLVQEHGASEKPGTTGYLSFDALRRDNQTFESLSAFAGWTAVLSVPGQETERLTGARVTWDFFRTLGIEPLRGRHFDPAEDHPDRRRAVIISHGLWTRQFHADPEIIGRSITINQAAYTLVGVLPPDLDELVTTRTFRGAEIWSLLGYFDGYPPACRTCRHIFVVGRLKPGATPDHAARDLTGIYQAQSATYPREYDRPRAVVTTLRERVLGPVKTPLYLMWGAVGLLLLMACANMANLLLIRSSEREGEIALRRALGISPPRLLRQLLTEAVLLAVIGGAAGILLAWWATTLLVAAAPEEIPRIREVGLNLTALVYALAVSVATGLVFGLAPARLLVLRDMRGAGASGSRRFTSDRGTWRYRAVLIALNVTLSVVLLVGSGLLVRSFARLLTVDTGFSPRGLLTFHLSLTGAGYDTNAGIARFFEDLTSRLAALPEVTHVSGSTQLPLTGSRDRSGITIEGRTYDNPAAAPSADRFAVLPDYFATMQIPLRRGRLFTVADGATAPPVAIVNHTMAEALWPGQDPIGQRIRVAGGPNNPMRTIVGIVGDVKHDALHLPETMQVYLPHVQTHYPEPYARMALRVAEGRDPVTVASAVRGHVAAIDARQPVAEMRTYDAVIAQTLATRRFTLLLLALFALTALVLAVVGMYGALSYVVSQRQRELGVRMALGAEQWDIAGLVVRQGMTPALVGVATGLLMGVGGSRLVASLLFGTSPTDAATFALVGGVMVAAALAACLIPARNAAKVQPSLTLKAP